ncbi:MAG TPA: hypothetical protein VJN01_00695 [Xanthomonadales bacterium]|nr:hypothetical protein [Xanthomonadales bacterium]
MTSSSMLAASVADESGSTVTGLAGSAGSATGSGGLAAQEINGQSNVTRTNRKRIMKQYPNNLTPQDTRLIELYQSSFLLFALIRNPDTRV